MFSVKKSTYGWTFFISLLSLLTTALVIVFHYGLVSFFEAFGCTHTFSYFSPYLVLLMCGTAGISITKRIVKRSLRMVIAFLLFLLPFAAGFALHPIYEDAIFIGGTDFNYNPDALGKNYNLSIIVIPDCPFCKMAIQQSGRWIKEENSSLEVVLCSADSTAGERYLHMLPAGVQLRQAVHPDSLALYSGGSFPAYCARISDHQMRVWSNNEFGPRAVDFITQR